MRSQVASRGQADISQARYDERNSQKVLRTYFNPISKQRPIAAAYPLDNSSSMNLDEATFQAESLLIRLRLMSSDALAENIESVQNMLKEWSQSKSDRRESLLKCVEEGILQVVDEMTSTTRVNPSAESWVLVVDATRYLLNLKTELLKKTPFEGSV